MGCVQRRVKKRNIRKQPYLQVVSCPVRGAKGKTHAWNNKTVFNSKIKCQMADVDHAREKSLEERAGLASEGNAL